LRRARHRWRMLTRCYAACACGTKPRCGPSAVLPGADKTINRP
jgi:hypothetical protein